METPIVLAPGRTGPAAFEAGAALDEELEFDEFPEHEASSTAVAARTVSRREFFKLCSFEGVRTGL